MNSHIHTIQDCQTELRDVSLKATPARIALLQLLESADTPLDTGGMFHSLQKQGIKTDQATVFRIINTFTQKGITKQLQFNESKFRYELSSKEDHHHLICEHCGDIEDISDCGIGQLEKEIEKKKRFTVKRHSLEFFGLCNTCQHLE